MPERTSTRALPLAGSLALRQRRALFGAFATVLVVIAGTAVHGALGVGGHTLHEIIRDWGSSAVYVLVAAIVVLRATRVGMSRAAWIVIAVGVSLYAAGNVVWSLWLQHVPKPPIPSVCDALWLALYPASYVGIALLARRCWRGIPGLELHVAVNVTAADLLDDGFPSQVSEALARRGLPAGALVIEVTENAVLSDPAHTRDVLGRLRDLGVELSLDDFGTGVSSLVHLKRIPVGEIKIDRSFVTRMNFDPADAAIVHATIDLAHRLGKRVVAEGVEDEHTWKRLAAAGCHVIQGYALSRPLPAQELAPLLDELGVRGPLEPRTADAFEDQRAAAAG